MTSAVREFDLRVEPGLALVDDAERIARACHAMALRFHRGGKLVVFGNGGGATDAEHIAVEFVHPVIVGKRALPAVSLAEDLATVTGVAKSSGFAEVFAHQVRYLADPVDIALGVSPDGRCENVRRGLEQAHEMGLLTIALTGGDGGALGDSPAVDHTFVVRSDDACVVKELHVTIYHVLWELVHVFFEHRGLLEGRRAEAVHDSGASSFLYPFLAEQEDDLDTVMADVRRSVLMKAHEVGELRAATLTEGRSALVAAAVETRDALDRGGKLLAFGNGGSATDAMDAAADFRAAPRTWPDRPALDLTEDSAILTALANDIGPDVLFARQIIAYGRDGDVALALSTSGSSTNIVEALAEARRRGLATVALIGYDGGRVAGERLADHVVVTPSEHIPRIQEAQASAYHVLRELVEVAGDTSGEER